MHAIFSDIITIGDELMIGQVLNTNSSFIASELTKIGVTIQRIISIPDREQDIILTLNSCLASSDIIIITGGLGPTSDDITKGTLAAYFGGNLKIHEESYKQLEFFFKTRRAKISERNMKQAELPDNCIVLPNKNGTAPGMLFYQNNKPVFSLPGVPFEMKALIMEEVLPVIRKDFELPFKSNITVLTTGLAESTTADMIGEWENKLPPDITIAYLPAPALLRLRISITGNNNYQIKNKLNDHVSELVKILGKNHVFGFDEDTLQEVAGKKLLTNNLTLSTAESCTGGNIAQLITSIPGSSDYFMGGIIAYSNSAKIEQLGVKASDIELYGAVSKSVVEQMAVGVRKVFNTSFGIATSGIAGPGGGSEEKPVGTTWIALASPNKVTSAKYLFGDNRERNIIRASLTALNLLRIAIDDFAKNSK
jgi:nicotinamide-nucleotide amidase